MCIEGSREGKLSNELVARYHHLGYRILVGAQMRYAVHDRHIRRDRPWKDIWILPLRKDWRRTLDR